MLSRLGARVATISAVARVSSRRSITAVTLQTNESSSTSDPFLHLQQQPRRHFASAAGGTDFEDAVLKARAKRKSKSMNAAWDAYLDTGAGAGDIFRAIDLSSNRQISPLELKLFVDSVDQKGVSQEGLALLAQLVEDNKDNKHHELDEQEFLQWLNIATNPPAASTEAPPEKSSAPAASSDSHDGIWKLRAKRKSKLMDTVWTEYLAQSDKDSSKIFKTIDLNRNLKISYLELKLFMDSVDPDNENISEDARQELDLKASHSDEEDEMDQGALDSWLSSALSN